MRVLPTEVDAVTGTNRREAVIAAVVEAKVEERPTVSIALAVAVGGDHLALERVPNPEAHSEPAGHLLGAGCSARPAIAAALCVVVALRAVDAENANDDGLVRRRHARMKCIAVDDALDVEPSASCNERRAGFSRGAEEKQAEQQP